MRQHRPPFLSPARLARGVALAALWMGAGAAALAQGAAPKPGDPQPPDVDPLALQSAPEAPAAAAPGSRFFVEGAVGRASQRHGLGDDTVSRLSLDFSRSFRLGEGWRARLSNRLDVTDPRAVGAESRTLNSLREAYVAWTPGDGQLLLEAGRINLRHGPAYGDNPTDFFGTGALRSPITVEPLQRRENRQGTVMLRGQWALGTHTLALAAAPKLDDRPDRSAFSLDLGSTNASSRLLGTWGTRWSERVNTQLLVLGERGQSPRLGANATALLGDAVVAYGEWSRGRGPSLATRLLGTGAEVRRDRIAAGVTLALPAKVSLTLEASRNGFGLTESERRAVQALGPVAFGNALLAAQARQEPFGRDAFTLYLTQNGLVWRSLDLIALVRQNTTDDSRLVWVELRHKGAGFDAALQWQHLSGAAFTEFGYPPVRSQVQGVVTWYF